MDLTEALRLEVRTIVAEIAEAELAEVTAETDLESLGVDSLGGLRIVAALEKKYGIVVSEAEIGRIRTMAHIFDLVDRLDPGVE